MVFNIRLLLLFCSSSNMVLHIIIVTHSACFSQLMKVKISKLLHRKHPHKMENTLDSSQQKCLIWLIWGNTFPCRRQLVAKCSISESSCTHVQKKASKNSFSFSIFIGEEG